ncbi:ectoine hydroxylase [Pontibacterium granulatum]|uniref:ectoine hydroxylase n=1 Tax=Pontibacterium granulatum TaxID=2036029 RepID=UPI00249A6D7F|nr:ectoine hydroxylase [Pontibacterium granulatum]MDI3325794.1 ectoine hydroxylase [Pontibacterium granulatum]
MPHYSQRENDAYPSRSELPAQMIERQDPVVYAPDRYAGPLTESQIRSYDENGFLIVENLFSEQELTELQQELARLKDNASQDHPQETISELDSGEMRSVFQVHQLSRIYKKLAADQRLAGIARFLLNDEVYIHQSRVNYKPGFRGKEFYWHSDFETWHTEDGMPRMRALSMSITLTDNYEQNGPLMLIPGSHRQYLVCEGDTPENHHEHSLKKQEYGVPSDNMLSQLVEQSEIVTGTCKAGSVIIFDCNVMHGSNGNITPHPRSNVFFVYNAISNRVEAPFGSQPPRPEHICTRQTIDPLPSGD